MWNETCALFCANMDNQALFFKIQCLLATCNSIDLISFGHNHFWNGNMQLTYYWDVQ